MKARAAGVQGALAALGLVAAYATWQRGPELGADEVVVLPGTPEAVTEIRLSDEKKQVVLERSKTGDFESVLRSQVLLPKPTPSADGGVTPEAGPDGGVSAPGAGPLGPPRTFGGNPLANRVFEKFGPLKAVRALGTLPPEKLKELGLVGSSRTLDVRVGGTLHHYVLSSGAGSPYLMNPSTGEIFLLSSGLISDLDNGTLRLVDRRLHTFKPDEIAEVTVSAGQARRVLSTKVTGAGTVEQASTRGTDAKDALAKAWLEKVWRLTPMEQLGKDETPAAGAPVEQFRVEYGGRAKPLGFLSFARVGTDTLARTEHTIGWVRLKVPDTVVTDAQKIAQGP